MKVYVVFQGDYSNRYVSAVFSTREAAEAYYDPGESSFDIEDYEVDAPADGKRIGKVWVAEIGVEDGSMSGVRARGDTLRHPGRCVVQITRKWRPEAGYAGQKSIQVRSPRSAAHCRKVLVEKRQEYLRSRVPEPGHEEEVEVAPDEP